MASKTKTKYRRYQDEAVDREKGVRRIQTPKIITTKWDPEIANKKTNKIGHKRNRDEKYGDWNENFTDANYEDRINRELREKRVREWTSPLRKQVLRADGWNDFWPDDEARAIAAAYDVHRSFVPAIATESEYILLLNEMMKGSDYEYVDV